MLYLIALFLGIFITDFCILHTLSQILNSFHKILDKKSFADYFFFLCKQYRVFD